MKIIDVHAHYCPKAYFTKLESRNVPPYVRVLANGALDLRYGPGRSSTVREGMYSIDRRLADMDAKGVELQVLSPLLHGIHMLDAKMGSELCRLVNDDIAEVVQKHRGRFEGFAVLPLQDIDESLAELERSITDLKMRGVVFFSNVEGRFLEDEAFWPLYEKIVELDVPVFIHPTHPVNDKGMADYGLVSTVGFLYDTTLTMLRIILSGLLERHASLKFILPHLGSVIPYITARIDKDRAGPLSSKRKIQRPPSEYFKRVYVDTVSLHEPALKMANESLGSRRLLFGCDCPFWGLSEGLESIVKLNLREEDKNNIFFRNAEAILKLE
jgi:aminocarboxymuconate-semialdehyde decarboxylase